MKNLSRFDISIIAAFVVIALAGGGAAYYLDAFQLAAAQSDVQEANAEFEKYSSKMVFLPTQENLKVLQGNIDLIHAQLDPMVKNYLQSSDNKLTDIANENTIDWKKKLDNSVAKLDAAANARIPRIPVPYYYGFSRYKSQTPAEENTAVLSKQLLAIEQMVNILIGAPVSAIDSIRRTEEEEPSGSSGTGSGGKQGEILPGHSVEVSGGLYTAYPFEIEFDATTDPLRKVVDDFMKSPYVFVIRSISVQNSQSTSPQLIDLDKIAGAPSSASVIDSPGAVAAAKSTAGPQYLFGGEILHVRVRVDFIEWKGLPSDTDNAGGTSSPNPASSRGRP